METYQSLDIKDLHCYGCAHMSGMESFPGKPSGERPCHFCIRNPKNHIPHDDPIDTWYDGAEPVSIPMDCYHTIDMKEQFEGLNKQQESGIRWTDIS